jgi:hypothetical protein
MRGSLSLVKPRPSEGLLARPPEDLDGLLRVVDFAVEEESTFDGSLAAVLEIDFGLRADLLFVLAVDFVDCRAMI